MTTVFEDENCLITFDSGDSTKAVISFTGIGYEVGGIQMGEFQKSLNNTAKSYNVYYVRDKTRRWYNSSFSVIRKILTDQLVNNKYSEVYTLGNSMGGFGASVFSGLLPNCFRSISFCAQSSVNSKIVPFENRWDQYVNAITDWVVPDATKILSKNTRYIFFYGVDDVFDIRHATRFANAGDHDLLIVLVEGCGHDVANFLKQRYVLYPALSILLDCNARLPDMLYEVLSGVPSSIVSAPITVLPAQIHGFSN